ncbi:LacI family DNA-binding transcriptional regulator [Peribacillus frigoritolerans]|mgnify:FL=1|jgi:LacI family transcriptional regulator|uniref:LacI family DNA-binding transcriptional regulator n=1 Tax=Peribacillus frigoritolerans TaxID=450367 RepID=A0AAJ1QIW8_9BACI|nr:MULTISPECIES: LacI family DNA-binding transcriptional regulator [Bacillaceae]KOR77170.1 LacI family transcriptional regulator [Bacillus sp. FJAT-21352]MBL3645937.1 LacI family DNA-binding transcriptional regulator [Bacillus sp. RHFB]MCD1164009.1 LacI family DNA-binding transcriptional regulator [Peribacillus castrilensis]MCP1097296.1 LacI family DNA-binding transcriptional regulator [Bacillaceae bacterium OS4b]MBT2617812.1 LacI family DNA-binding transcriptional regulator [Bacillus sp. ISL-
MKQSKKGRVTLQQVAKHAGVSTSTASLIVRNNPRISEATRKKVLKSMHELGYVYDRIAANLRSQSSDTVGIIITDISNTFFSEFLIGVHDALDEVGYTVLLGTTFDSVAKQDHLLSTMMEHRVGGLILCPVSESSQDTIERLNEIDTPMVLAVRELPGVNSDYVGIDYPEGARIAVDHLLGKGHKRIALLGGIKESSTWIERMEGYREALSRAGLEVDESLVIDSAPTREGGLEAVLKVLENPNPPTAIFCFSDLIAFGVMQGLMMKGITPGKDMDIVGFDNVPVAEIYHPPLTTISSFPRRIGKEAANLLYQQMEKIEREQQRIILNPELIIRESS